MSFHEPSKQSVYWQPVHVTTVDRSLVLFWNDSTQVVAPEEYRLLSWSDSSEREPAAGAPCIRAARLRLRIPEVICLASYDRLPGASVTFSQRNVAKRDHHTCQYCGAQPGGMAITIDHVSSILRWRARIIPTDERESIKTVLRLQKNAPWCPERRPGRTRCNEGLPHPCEPRSPAGMYLRCGIPV